MKYTLQTLTDSCGEQQQLSLIVDGKLPAYEFTYPIFLNEDEIIRIHGIDYELLFTSSYTRPDDSLLCLYALRPIATNPIIHDLTHIVNQLTP